LYDRYKKPLTSIALLIDENSNWRPSHYEHRLWGCQLRFDFVAIKLLDYELQRAPLLESINPFALVILAHLDALKTKDNEQQRFVAKFNLTRRLYEKGWDKRAIFNLFTFIDYVMALPEPLEIKYSQALEQLEKERKMRYITSIERIGIKKGLEKGLEQGLEQGWERGLVQGREEGLEQGLEQGEKIVLLHLLERKFGTIPEHYRTQLEQANTKLLLAWAENLIVANSFEEVFKDLIKV
jgi:hypothetical protein